MPYLVAAIAAWCSGALLAAVLALPQSASRCTEVAWQAVTVPALGELQEVDMRGKTVLITGATSGLGLWHAEAGC